MAYTDKLNVPVQANAMKVCIYYEYCYHPSIPNPINFVPLSRRDMHDFSRLD